MWSGQRWASPPASDPISALQACARNESQSPKINYSKKGSFPTPEKIKVSGAVVNTIQIH